MKLLRELLQEAELTEAPQQIQPLKLNRLENPRENIKLAKKIIKYSPEAKLLEITSTGIKLFELVANKEHEIFAIDDDGPQIAYYVRFEVQAADFIDLDWVTQVLVWKSTILSPKSEGLAKYVFFKYVVPLTGTVVSDGLQTPDGERFWKYRIPDAFTSSKYKVYLLNFNDKTVRRIKTINDYKKLIYTDKDPWGPTGYHKGLRLAISDHDLIQE